MAKPAPKVLAAWLGQSQTTGSLVFGVQCSRFVGPEGSRSNSKSLGARATQDSLTKQAPNCVSVISGECQGCIRDVSHPSMCFSTRKGQTPATLNQPHVLHYFFLLLQLILLATILALHTGSNCSRTNQCDNRNTLCPSPLCKHGQNQPNNKNIALASKGLIFPTAHVPLARSQPKHRKLEKVSTTPSYPPTRFI